MKKIVLLVFLLCTISCTAENKKPESVTNCGGGTIKKIKYEGHDYLVYHGFGDGICHSESCRYCDSINRLNK